MGGKITVPSPVEDEMNQEATHMEASIREVEKLLKYSFQDKKLLEEALTHSSYTSSPSYQRLEFVGDSALGLAFSKYAFLTYPHADQGELTLVRAANVSTENLARVAVHHQLYNYVRHNVAGFDERVREFLMMVQEEAEPEIFGGLVKAPKVLADIVESLAAAVYVDCNYNLEAMWMIFRDLLEPMFTLDDLEKQPQPVTQLLQMCQKDGKKLDIDYGRKEDKFIASVFVDGDFITSASSKQKDNAKLNAAKDALRVLSDKSGDLKNIYTDDQINEDGDIEGAKHKLHNLCDKKKWPKPIYEIIKEYGCGHKKRYICSVEIKIRGRVLINTGKEKKRVKKAENSAASAGCVLVTMELLNPCGLGFRIPGACGAGDANLVRELACCDTWLSPIRGRVVLLAP